MRDGEVRGRVFPRLDKIATAIERSDVTPPGSLHPPTGRPCLCAGAFADGAQALQQRLWTDLDHSAGVHGNEVLRKLAARRGRQVTLLVVFSSGLGSTSGDASELLTGLGSIAHAISQTPHGDPAAAAAVAQVLRKVRRPEAREDHDRRVDPGVVAGARVTAMTWSTYDSHIRNHILPQ